MSKVVGYRNQDGNLIIRDANAKSFSQVVYCVGCPESNGLKGISKCTTCWRCQGFTKAGVMCQSEKEYKPLTSGIVETREVKLRVNWK